MGLDQTEERSTAMDAVVVVSGLPRSGTSMMMSMLEAGGLPLLKDDVRTADTDNPKGYFEFERVKKLREGDVDWLPEAQGRAVKIISYLLLHLPATYDYRVIFMQRDLDEVMASQRKMLTHRGEDPNKLEEHKLKEVMRKHLLQVEDWTAQQGNIERLDVPYQQIIQKPQPFINAIDRFLGAGLDLQKMGDMIDPNLYRQRGPKRK
jgi:hypothetical protein